MARWFFAVMLTLAVTPSIASEGLDRPFGVERGQPVRSTPAAGQLVRRADRLPSAQALTALFNELRLSAYEPQTVPMPHPLLERYVVLATERAGVCSVAGMAKTGNGEAHQRFETLRKQLSEVMGHPTDRLAASERSAVWRPKAGPVRTVSLATAGDMTVLKFDFTNLGQCDPAQVGNPFK